VLGANEREERRPLLLLLPEERKCCSPRSVLRHVLPQEEGLLPIPAHESVGVADRRGAAELRQVDLVRGESGLRAGPAHLVRRAVGLALQNRQAHERGEE